MIFVCSRSFFIIIITISIIVINHSSVVLYFVICYICHLIIIRERQSRRGGKWCAKYSQCIKMCFALARFLHIMHQMIMCNAPMSQKVHHSLWSWTCYASIPPIEATLVYKHASIWRVWNRMLLEVRLRRSKSWSFLWQWF